jgi:hypothetical protein
MVAGLAAIWVTAVIRKVVTGSVPSLLTITAIELTVQAAVVLATGELWLFLLQFPLANLAMCVLFARTAGGPDPLIARLAAEVVALRQPAVRHPGLHRFFQGATTLNTSVPSTEENPLGSCPLLGRSALSAPTRIRKLRSCAAPHISQVQPPSESHLG